MIVAYWIVVGLLAVLYLYSGAMKLIRSKDQLRPMMGWVDTMPLAAVRTIGALEILGVVGLLIPPLTGIAPVLALAAAIGFTVLQLFAIALHLRRGEGRMLGLNVAAILLSAIAIWLATVWL